MSTMPVTRLSTMQNSLSMPMVCAGKIIYFMRSDYFATG
jgi:hypothetical protein